LKIPAKKAVFIVVSGKNQFHHFCPPLEKFLKKSTSALLIKSFRRPCTQALHHFCKNCVVLHHLATLFNNAKAVSKL